MYKKAAILATAGLVFFVYVGCSQSKAKPHPLTRTETLALIAGGVFSENIVRDTDSRGLAFALDDNFNSLATSAGADTKVLTELEQRMQGLPAMQGAQVPPGRP